MRALTVLLLASLLLVPSASAVVWTYRCPEMATCPTSNGSGQLVSSELRFNDGHLDFTWNARFEPNAAGDLPTGMWAVVSKGPEPELTAEQFAIIYGDVATGRVSAYVYDKNLGEDSWQVPGAFIQTFPGALTSWMSGTARQWQLIVNVGGINTFPGPTTWTGLYFDSEVGFWIAGLRDANFTFAPDGQITSFSFSGRTSYDRADRTSGPPVSVESGSWGRVKATYR